MVIHRSVFVSIWTVFVILKTFLDFDVLISFFLFFFVLLAGS